MSLRAFNVWAYQSGFNEEYGVPFCRDARLAGAPSTMNYPQGNLSGQAGWHMAIPFDNLDDLYYRLATWTITPQFGGGSIGHGEIHRLAIFCHGAPGSVYVSGTANQALTATHLVQSRGTRESLVEIGLFTSQSSREAIDPLTYEPRALRRSLTLPPSRVIFSGCRMAQGPTGSRLLVQLSHLWPSRAVVGYTTWGVRPQQRSAGVCLEPGMIITQSPRTLGRRAWKIYYRDHLLDLLPNGLPWASEDSPHAKWAINGHIDPERLGGDNAIQQRRRSHAQRIRHTSAP